MRDSRPVNVSPHVDGTGEEREALEARLQAELEAQLQAAVDGIQALAQCDAPVANIRGTLLGLVVCTLVQAVTEGWLHSPEQTVDAVNQRLAANTDYRLVRQH
jgi:hypothetical protein